MIEVRNISEEPLRIYVRGEQVDVDPGKSLELSGYVPTDHDGPALPCEPLYFSPVHHAAQGRRVQNGIRQDEQPKDLTR